ncbi:glycosyltransferase family 39 protein [Clostridium vincentii]|uniref:Dolichyl-phosphate-mannose-protein mannosyltransferase n=1 Tax=Clostridium vincentii TaxID=52704 RepID=A0A2T0B7W5_9CLOT|nr:glycosyltransferase family 39 protein [Clostridium vincentii]PRR79979.1 Dolichyl-phosphate-mannose-protein mannosyltransferase [Clostridium vincentii]
MEKISKGFTTFMVTALKILLVCALIASVGFIFTIVYEFNISAVIVLGISCSTIYLGHKLVKSNISDNKKIGIVLLWAIVIRTLWLLNVNSVPNSDYKTMYSAAQSFISGDNSMFWGTSYIARFPHLTMMVLYMGFMRNIFPVENLIAMKAVNLFLGVTVILLIYLIIRKIFKNRTYGMYAAIIASIFPPLVTYTGVFCTENIAIPFYLLSIYLFIVGIKDKKHWWILSLCGITLAIGNLFRMVALVVVIAYVMYIILYTTEKVRMKIRNILVIGASYGLIICTVSGVLQVLQITEYPLWSGSEPGITNVLKGTNYESGGAWNPEDAALPEQYNYDYDIIEEKSRDIIVERLTTTPPVKLFGFYVKKFVLQWNQGDLAGVFWTERDVPEDEIIVGFGGGGTGVLQLIYVVVMVLSLIGLFNRKKIDEKPEIKLFHLLLCGYGLMYLITEYQSRYAYIVCWLFIILSVVGIDSLLKRFNKLEER